MGAGNQRQICSILCELSSSLRGQKIKLQVSGISIQIVKAMRKLCNKGLCVLQVLRDHATVKLTGSTEEDHLIQAKLS